MRDIVKLWTEYRVFILVGVVLATLVVCLPMIIRGFFFLVLMAMKNPLESLVLMGTALVFYSLGLYMERKSY